MKNNLTELVFILDRSGSMSGLVNDTIGGFNSMIEKQKKEDGEAYVTTVLFDNNYELLHDHVDIKDVKEITNKDYYAQGLTALLDAIGRTINSIGKRLSDTPEEERPEKVIFVIATDGEENSSVEFTKTNVREMIEHQQNKYSWQFIFLGANMDAVAEASSLGISSGHSHTYTANNVGTASIYNAMSDTLACLRSMSTDTFACADCVDSVVAASLSSVE